MNWLLMTLAQAVFSIFMYIMGAIFFGAALVPGLALVMKVWTWTADLSLLPRLFWLGSSIAMGYFIFGLTLIFLVGLFRTVLNLRLQEGVYSLTSFQSFKWAFMGSLYLIIRSWILFF